jgi:hypothetical protein
MEYKNCPSCGSKNLMYKHEIKFGHGDCTFEAWIQCDCGIRGGYVSGWGTPTVKDNLKAWEIWNGKRSSD